MATKKKYQSGGPAEAMLKAMGKKPTSTKETLKYVSKNGSGYLPPVKSDTLKDTSKPQTVKPKAQLGKIVKMIDKAMDAGKAVKKVSKAPLDFRKVSTKTDVSDAFKQAERARLKKMLQDADKAKGKMQTGGATSKKKLSNVNTIPAAKNKFTAPTKRPMMAKMGGATKKKC
jgi:hypothetical protein